MYIYIYHLRQDLLWDFGWTSYLIKYAHNGWSCDLGKVQGLAECQYLYFSQIFYAFLNEPGCSVMSVWCPDDNSNCFQWILMIFGIYVIGVKIFDGIEYEHHITKYAHNGWSWDFGFFGIPELNFSVRTFKLGVC